MTSYPQFSELSREQKFHLVKLGILFAEAKNAIQVLTLCSDADAVFQLKDEDWVKICGLEIEYRILFEQAIKEKWNTFETLWAES
jgi:hypothetical protein